MILGAIFKHNWFASLYFNFRMLPFKQAIRLPFDFCHSVRFGQLSGKIHLETNVLRMGMIKIGTQGSDMFPKSETIISIQGDVYIKSYFVLGAGSSFISRPQSEIHIGRNVIFGARNLIFCEKKIEFGDDFLTSWDCQIMDSDTHALIDVKTNIESEYKKPVSFGNHVWCGNGVVINKGSKLPSNSVVASRSLCNKDFSSEPEYCVFAGTPAKVISKNKKWRL